MKTVILFASGSGSNVENIVNYFREKQIEINFHVFTNNKEAYVLERAKKLSISADVFTREEMNNGSLLHKVVEIAPDLIVLAGFLWMFPASIIMHYPNKVINVHPALLPKFGGKGMYGNYVHEAVKQQKETETGITIHYVNEKYDEGAVIFQATTAVLETDTAADIAGKVHLLEYEFFPKVIEDLLSEQ